MAARLALRSEAHRHIDAVRGHVAELAGLLAKAEEKFAAVKAEAATLRALIKAVDTYVAADVEAAAAWAVAKAWREVADG